MRHLVVLTFTVVVAGLGVAMLAHGDQRPLIPADAPPCPVGPTIDPDRPLSAGPGGFFAVDGVPPQPGAGTDAGLALRLSGPQSVQAGQDFRLSYQIENRGPGPRAVVDPLDGSMVHWRFPTHDLYLRDSQGTVWRFGHVGPRCGNMNPLKDDDVTTLAVGASHDLTSAGWSAFARMRIDTPGVYTAWAVYTMCPGRRQGEAELLGEHPVAYGRWASSAVDITVSAPD